MAKKVTKTTKAPKKIISRKEVTLNVPVVRVPAPFQGFINFVREQGVVGLAVGLVLGTATKSLVDSVVVNIFNPVVGLMIGGKDLSQRFICLRRVGGVCTAKIGYGQVISDIIAFMTVALAMFLIVHYLKLDRLDKKKSA